MRSIVLRSTVMAAALATSLVGAAQAPDSAQLLAQARQALGGEARLNAVRTFKAKGAIVMDDGGSATRTYGSFEIVCELPDKFLETETRRYASAGDGAKVDIGTTYPLGSRGTGPSSSSYTSTIGFNAAHAILRPSYSDNSQYVGRAYMGPPPITDEQLQLVLPQAKQDFVQWTLALFASSFAGAPVQFGPGSAGAGDTVSVSDKTTEQLRFDPTTHLPRQLGTLEYLDYRTVSGLQVPFRLHRLAPQQGRPGTDWLVEEFEYDVAVSAKTFKATKAGS
ncbi:MAG TPA: hypothetical protein VJN96_04605 [Vicinamibacterales bacterium]|nr:hypothetical protein [Vicinamibacterales bacterium]